MNSRKWVIDGMGSHWFDDGERGHSYLDLKIEGEFCVIPVHDIHISHEDLDRLARASDAVHYLNKFLAGEEICSFSDCEHQH